MYGRMLPVTDDLKEKRKKKEKGKENKKARLRNLEEKKFNKNFFDATGQKGSQLKNDMVVWLAAS